MDNSIIKETAMNLGMEPRNVVTVADEFMLRLRRAQFERYEPEGGDYLGASPVGTLFRALPRQAFFHFLGLYQSMQRDHAEWKQGYASKVRLASRSEWFPFAHQMEGWKKGNYWVGRWA